MNFDQYQLAASKTALPQSRNIPYMTLGLAGEAGEVANKIKKLIRDGDTPDKRNAIVMEIGDVLWYCAGLATELGYSLQFIASANINKLAAREIHSKLTGSGDNR